MISSPPQGKCPCSLEPLASDKDHPTTTPRPSQRGQKGQAPRETGKEADQKLDNPYGLSDKKRRRSLKKLNTPVPHHLSSPHIFINIYDPRTRCAFGGMEDTRHPHPFLPSPSLKKPSTDEEYLPQKPGHMQGKRNERNTLLPPCHLPPPTTKKALKGQHHAPLPSLRPAPPSQSLLSSLPFRFLKKLARSCSLFQLRRARLSVSHRGAFPWRSSASTGAPRTLRSAPTPSPLPCGRYPSRSFSTSPAIGRGPPRPRPSHACSCSLS